MIVCKELNREFENKEALFKALRENVKDLTSIKKAQITESREKGLGVGCKNLDFSKYNGVNKDLFADNNYYYIAVNTTNILDSHSDLHKDGIWNKSSKERSGKNYLLDTHIMTMANTLAKKEDIEIFVANIPFSLVGKSYKGDTEALIYKIPKDKMSDLGKDWLDGGYDIEASVKMQYVILDIAMNSVVEEDREFKKNFDENINTIANKEEYEEEYGEIYYFWIIREAKNIEESSLCLRGSNGATGQIKNEPSKDTQSSKEAVNGDTSHNSNFYNII